MDGAALKFGGEERIGGGAKTAYVNTAFDFCQLIFLDFSFVKVDDAQRFHDEDFYVFLFTSLLPLVVQITCQNNK